ncbi:MAG: hypothetical protein WBD22_00900 [Pyrinomonadaceae bacterium]
MANENLTAEEKRLADSDSKAVDWKNWGCYVSERAWGTVREDYSADGSAWDYFPFEHAHCRTFRWNEDGLAGICDRRQFICFGLSLWNGRDSILKERLFGLAGPKGNHGEDVKEYYYYLDNTPTHSYMKFLYKYPQEEFPYANLYEETARRDKKDPEYELIDTGVFADDRYFDVTVEYAKSSVDDICIKITAVNRGPETATLRLLPTIWFRNTWSWTTEGKKPIMNAAQAAGDLRLINIEHESAGNYQLAMTDASGLRFTENETNNEKLFQSANSSPYSKDGINDFVVQGNRSAVNPENYGTKAAADYELSLAPGGSREVFLRLLPKGPVDPEILTSRDAFIGSCREVFKQRIHEADEFYETIIPAQMTVDAKNVMRQALAGMLWSKQFYHYVVEQWLDGDPAFPEPPKRRRKQRNASWTHLYNEDIVSMPDKWEYPWYAAWDLAFHCIPLSLIDPGFAKRQLILLLREWYMHPNGQVPAYEWAFSDVNPPVHAWAALRVYKIEAKQKGVADRIFLERVFHKLLLNFTWWVNRKDTEDNNVFEGGFLGLDNIGVFDRSAELPGGGRLEQSDGTSWMAMYCLNMLAISLELAKEDVAYEDVASKFFEHFVFIADAMNNLGNECTELWNEADGFYYDVIHKDGTQIPIKLRSMVGLIPLFAVETLDPEWIAELPNFRRRTDWFLTNRKDLTGDIACMQETGVNGRKLLALVNKERLKRILSTMLSEEEFLSDHGIRSLSRKHKSSPYIFELAGTSHRVDYEPGESQSGMFGGNSNWRGPVWFPVNYLLIESLQKFDHYYGSDLIVEFPTGSGREMTLWQVAQELEKRLCGIFLRDDDGRRALHGQVDKFQTDEHWRENLLFHEYFHGDNGRGLGASHQTGWTGLVAKLLKQIGEGKQVLDGKRIDLSANLTVAELLGTDRADESDPTSNGEILERHDPADKA